MPHSEYRMMIKGEIYSMLMDAMSGYSSTHIHLGSSPVGAPLPHVVFKVNESMYEDGSSMNVYPDSYPRQFDIEIEIREELFDGVDYKLDDMCLAVERSMSAWESFPRDVQNTNTYFDNLILLSTEYEMSGDGERGYGVATLYYQGVDLSGTLKNYN